MEYFLLFSSVSCDTKGHTLIVKGLAQQCLAFGCESSGVSLL